MAQQRRSTFGQTWWGQQWIKVLEGYVAGSVAASAARQRNEAEKRHGYPGQHRRRCDLQRNRKQLDPFAPNLGLPQTATSQSRLFFFGRGGFGVFSMVCWAMCRFVVKIAQRTPSAYYA